MTLEGEVDEEQRIIVYPEGEAIVSPHLKMVPPPSDELELQMQ